MRQFMKGMKHSTWDYRNEPFLWTFLHDSVVSWSKLKRNIFVTKNQGSSWDQCARSLFLWVPLGCRRQDGQKEVRGGSHFCRTQTRPSSFIFPWIFHGLLLPHDHGMSKPEMADLFQHFGRQQWSAIESIHQAWKCWKRARNRISWWKLTNTDWHASHFVP